MANIWPVIHVSSASLALENAAMADELGAHGVFLIHMDGKDEMLDPLATQIRQAHPRLKLGVNYLSLDVIPSVRRAIEKGYDASWSDAPGVRSNAVSDEALYTSGLLSAAPTHRLFASVAFKYQQSDPDPGAAAVEALKLGFTPTTSGKATGIAPSLEKIQKMYQDLSPYRHAKLAVASGITPDNVAVLAPMLSDILVSTGISSDFYTFDEDLLTQLIERSSNSTR